MTPTRMKLGWLLLRLADKLLPNHVQVLNLLLKVLDKLIRGPVFPIRTYTLRFHLGAQNFFEGDKMRLTNEQRSQVRVVPRTQAGNVAPVDGPVVLTSSDTSVAVIEGDYVRAVGAGVTQITATFDADLSGEVREVILTGAVEVVLAEAVSGELVFGEPELSPPVE